MDDDTPIGPNLNHPDALIRLASAVHRFKCPDMGSKKLSYVKAFKTSASRHANTQDVMKKSDAARGSLLEALAGSRSDSTGGSRAVNISHESVVNATSDYIPYVSMVLLSCKVQPDTARLDEKLVFEWSSGMESSKYRKKFKSEALMYELVMSVSCLGLSTIGLACDESVNGDFPAASRRFKTASGIFEFLSQDLLPKWIARGSSVQSSELPVEGTLGVTEALKLLCLACAQQMAVATVLVKPGTPNYSLLAKLCLGIAEQIDHAVSTFRTKAASQISLIDESFFTLLAFQTGLQRSLTHYFLARSAWDGDEYGLAIALLRESTSLLQTRETPTSGHGLPEIDKKSGLSALSADLSTLRTHLDMVRREWEKDNSTIYFEKVPRPVPEDRKLSQGMSMMKPERYGLGDDVEPLPLSLPGDGDASKPPVPTVPPPPPTTTTLERSDSDLARELQEKLNRGEIS